MHASHSGSTGRLCVRTQQSSVGVCEACQKFSQRKPVHVPMVPIPVVDERSAESPWTWWVPFLEADQGIATFS